jgi:hypothetical protein
MINYCNKVKGFMTHNLFKEILVEVVLDVRIRCVKKNMDLYVITIHFLQNRFIEKYVCWFAYGEPYVPYEIMIEMMVGSTSSCSNMHRVVDDNSNPYRSMTMNVIGMNQGYANECSIIDEEPNVDATRFFDLLKDYDKPL